MKFYMPGSLFCSHRNLRKLRLLWKQPLGKTVPFYFHIKAAPNPTSCKPLTTRTKFLCQERSPWGFNSVCDSFREKLQPDRNQKPVCPYHFPFGLVVRSTQAKWNHSMGHCKTKEKPTEEMLSILPALRSLHMIKLASTSLGFHWAVMLQTSFQKTLGAF